MSPQRLFSRFEIPIEPVVQRPASGAATSYDEANNSYPYGPHDAPIEQISSGGTISYLHQDQLGSTRLLTNTSGTVVGSTTYDPYGKVASTSGSITTPLGFQSESADRESGLVYLRARYYDHATAQFLTVDPALAFTGQSYAYAGNDPLNTIDPMGLWGWNPLKNIEQGASDTVHFVEKHKQAILTTVAITAAVVATSTGVGALADVAILGLDAGALGAISTTASLVVAGLDLPDCIRRSRCRWRTGVRSVLAGWHSCGEIIRRRAGRERLGPRFRRGGSL